MEKCGKPSVFNTGGTSDPLLLLHNTRIPQFNTVLSQSSKALSQQKFCPQSRPPKAQEPKPLPPPNKIQNPSNTSLSYRRPSVPFQQNLYLLLRLHPVLHQPRPRGMYRRHKTSNLRPNPRRTLPNIPPKMFKLF
jgi:hypothetical protein